MQNLKLTHNILLLSKLRSWHQVMLAMIIGGIVGHVLGEKASALLFLGEVFLNLIKMVTIPLIFFTIIYGITGIQGYSGLYRISLKAICSFLITGAFAAIIGISAAMVLGPGFGVIIPGFNDAECKIIDKEMLINEYNTDNITNNGLTNDRTNDVNNEVINDTILNNNSNNTENINNTTVINQAFKSNISNIETNQKCSSKRNNQQQSAQQSAQQSVQSTLLVNNNSVVNTIIPQNIFASLVHGNIIHTIVFAFFMGIAMHIKRDQSGYAIMICHQIATMLFKMIEVIMKIAPIGVFGYIAYIVGTQGVLVVSALAKLIYTVFAACCVQYLLFGLMILIIARLSPIPFFKKIIGMQLLAFSTSSSKAVLVPLMHTLESRLGISKQSSKFVLPLSAVLNMDGGAIYQAVCAIFFVQMLSIDLSLINYATLIVMCTIASIGGAGIPGGVMLFLGMVLTSIGLPIEGVLIVATIDRILDMATTTINVTGDACITLLIDESEKTLNKSIYYS